MTDTQSKPAVGTADTPDPITTMNLWQKLAAITGELGSIAKDGKNKEQGYAFIEYGAVGARLRELYGKYHVDFLPNMGERIERELITKSGAKGVNVLIKFKFTFINADKPDEKQEAEWEGEASDYGDKATNKAATAAAKYFQMRKFNITEQGDDPDSTTIDRGVSKEPPRPKRPTIADAIAKATGVLSYKGFTEADERKAVVLKIAGVTEVKELSPEKLDHVMEILSATTGKELRGYLEAEKTEEVVAQDQTDGEAA